MIRLIQIELRRLWWRRAVRALAVVAILVPIIVAVTVFFQSKPASEAERADAQAQVDAEAAQPYIAKDIARCEKKPEQYFGDQVPDDVAKACAESLTPRLDWFLYETPLNLKDQATEGSGLLVIAVIGITMLLAGATFAGHDWTTGSMSNQLLFEPRRSRVWFAKAAAVLIHALVVGGLVLAGYWLALHAISVNRGITESIFDWDIGYASALRGLGLVGAAAIGGYCMSMLFRSTVVTLGVVFAISVVAPILFAFLTFDGHIQAQPQNQGLGVIAGKYEIVDYDKVECQSDDTAPGCRVVMTARVGAGYFGALVLLAGVPSWLLYRRRDVG